MAGFLGMLIALPVAAIIVVLLKHVREWYEHSTLYLPQNATVVVENHGNTQNISLESEQVDLDIEFKNTQDNNETKSDNDPL